MPRPKKPAEESRRRQVRFRLTDAEYERVRPNAEAAGVSVPVYMRRAALRSRVVVREAPKSHDVRLVAELNRIGVNLNQLVRGFHATGKVPPRLAELCDRIEELVVAAAEGD